MSKQLVLTAIACAILHVSTASGQVFRDDFDVANNYASFPTGPGGMWSGVHNKDAGSSPTDANITAPGNLNLGMDAVGWENSNATAPFLYRLMDIADVGSVRARISSQTEGNWSLGGVMVRLPGPLGNDENWAASWSFRPSGQFWHQGNVVTNNVENERNNTNLALEDLEYVRLDNLGGGTFRAYRGHGPNENNISWTPLSTGTQTNPNLASGMVEVGLAAGAIGSLAGSSIQFDWMQILPPVVLPPPFTTKGQLYSVQDVDHNRIGSTVDHWKFTVHSPGTVNIDLLSWEDEFDVNGDGERAFFDPYIYLFVDDGSLDEADFITSSDDSELTYNDGSITSLDSFLSNELNPGKYLLAVGAFPLSVADAIAGINSEDTFYPVKFDDLNGLIPSDHGAYQITWTGDVSVVPEPSTILLLMFASAVVIGRSRHRRPLKLGDASAL